uniref:Voltage-dependent calcium channel alpha-2/delta subunit conserved region domain-containing protein n=1 Tax=Knipowitschia caucasica TaxID=637954 RepID=A0AAV2LYW4_KNICA
MKLDFFQKKFWTASRQCAALDGKCSISCDDENINCYLIDNNGFILVAEDYTLTGKFFGEAEGAVMNKLLLMGSFNRMGRSMQVPCDTEYPAFISERTIKENTGHTDCDGCIKSFVIQQIPSSNLFMVVVDNKCDCSMYEPITMDPIEIMYNESLKCERLKMQKDRRRPDPCHPFHPEENSMECGGASGLAPSLSAIFLCVLLTVSPRAQKPGLSSAAENILWSSQSVTPAAMERKALSSCRPLGEFENLARNAPCTHPCPIHHCPVTDGLSKVRSDKNHRARRPPLSDHIHTTLFTARRLET